MRNILLSDVDGVLLNWEDSFEEWMYFRHKISRTTYTEFDHRGFDIAKSFGINTDEAYEFIKEFNTSDEMTRIPPLRDAVKYVRKLYEEHGIVLHCITNFGVDAAAQKKRDRNLYDVFNGAIRGVIYLPHSASKEEALKLYSGRGLTFVEDRMDNVDLAESLDIRGILMQHDYNKDYAGLGIRTADWKGIYHYLMDSEKPDAQFRFEQKRARDHYREHITGARGV